jgi:hypothetical protein
MHYLTPKARKDENVKEINKFRALYISCFRGFKNALKDKTVPYIYKIKIFLGTVKYQIKSSEKEEIVCLG